MHRYDRLDYADRWLSDSFRVLQENAPGFIGVLDMDMTRARAVVETMRGRGLAGSYVAVLVRAVGLALSRHPDCHALLVGSRRMRPDSVSIGVSVSGEAAASPVMRIEKTETKTIVEVCQEIFERAPEVRAEDSRTLAKLRRWGWLIPTGWLRRFVLRQVLSSLRFRRLFGSMQVTVVPGVDIVAPLAYGAPVVVGVGRIEDRVVAREGKPAVRLMTTMSFVGDHKLWNGERIVRMMGEIKRIIESDELMAEIPAEDATSRPGPAASNGGVVNQADKPSPV